jgi:hypothetical protein
MTYRITGIERSSGRAVQVHPDRFEAATAQEAVEKFAAEKGIQPSPEGFSVAGQFWLARKLYRVTPAS